MKGYHAWPARIIQFPSKTRAEVYFLGTHNTGKVELSQICLFQNCTSYIRRISNRNEPDFVKGIKEAELLCGISEKDSIINMN